MQRVTDILKDVGLIDATHFTQEARDRGTAVHLATQLHDEGDLDEDYQWGDRKAQLRFQAYQKFRREMKVNIIEIELELVHPVLGYVGHVDRLCEINGLRGVLDIKPPGQHAWHPLQLAAYQQAAPGGVKEWPACWNLYLGEGTYHLEPRRNLIQPWYVFRAALTVAQFKESTK